MKCINDSGGLHLLLRLQNERNVSPDKCEKIAQTFPANHEEKILSAHLQAKNFLPCARHFFSENFSIARVT